MSHGEIKLKWKTIRSDIGFGEGGDIHLLESRGFTVKSFYMERSDYWHIEISHCFFGLLPTYEPRFSQYNLRSAPTFAKVNEKLFAFFKDWDDAHREESPSLSLIEDAIAEMK